MSLVASVVDGVLQTSGSSSDQSKTSKGSALSKDDFLQLLVAQMKYQDPMEPTSNTEYVSQFAQYSQVEELQNMSNTMGIQRATGLVGQAVRIATTSTAGDTNYITGMVDYVSISGGKAYLAVNNNLYPVEDLDTVIDTEASETSLQRAISLTGKAVKMATVDSSGKTEYVTGVVDYVSVSKGIAYVSINNKSYPASDLEEVMDTEYWKKLNTTNGGTGDSDSSDSDTTTGDGSTTVADGTADSGSSGS